MSKYLTVLLLLVCTQIHALPCATTGKDTEKGDTIEQVLAKCGAPYDRKSYTTTIITAQRLVYYKSMAVQQFTLAVTLNNDQVSNLELNHNAVSNTNICGNVINVGDAGKKVLASCGNPNVTSTLASKNVEVTEMKYANISPVTWVFENGKLVDWKN